MSEANVTSTSSQILAYKERQGWSIRNLSDVAINVTFDGSDPVTIDSGTNPGVQIPVGQTLICTSGARDYSTPWNAVYAIHAGTGNKRVAIQEW